MPSARRPPESRVAMIRLTTNTPVDNEAMQILANVLFDAMFDADVESATQQSMQEAPEAQVPVLSGAELERLAPLQGFRKSFVRAKDNSQCPICFRIFKPNLHVRRMPCGHVFCSGCISRWVCKSSASCPVCRSQFTSSSP